MKNRSIFKRRGAYTLVEMLIVLAIILSIAGFLGVPMYQRAQVNSQIASATRAIQAAKSAVALYATQSDGLPLPISYSQDMTIPVTGTLGGVNPQNYIDLQSVLVAARCLEAPISVTLGETGSPNLTIPVRFNSSTQSFYTTSDAAPTSLYADSTTGIPTYPRLLCVGVSNAGGATINGSGSRVVTFSLDGSTTIAPGTRIIVWQFARVNANTAYELARRLYNGTVAAVGTAQTVGPVMYPAAGADGTVPVYVYVTHY